MSRRSNHVAVMLFYLGSLVRFPPEAAGTCHAERTVPCHSSPSGSVGDQLSCLQRLISISSSGSRPIHQLGFKCRWCALLNIWSSEVVMQNAGSDSIRANCVLTRWSLSAKDIVRLSPSRSHPQMSLEYLTNWSFSETVSQQGEYRSLQMLGRYISASDIWDVILHPYIACWSSIILPVCALQKESMWFGMRSTSCHLSVFFRLHSQYDISSALQRTVGRVAVKACHLAHCKMLQ